MCVFVSQQGYTQQDYSSYGQPAATDSTYQAAPSAGGYTQQQYAAAYGQSTAPGLLRTRVQLNVCKRDILQLNVFNAVLSLCFSSSCLWHCSGRSSGLHSASDSSLWDEQLRQHHGRTSRLSGIVRCTAGIHRSDCLRRVRPAGRLGYAEVPTRLPVLTGVQVLPSGCVCL